MELWGKPQTGLEFNLGFEQEKRAGGSGPRAQADRALYKKAISSLTKAQDSLEIIIGEVADFWDQVDLFLAWFWAMDQKSYPKKLFLRLAHSCAVLSTLAKKFSGGRMGDDPSVKLAKKMDEFGLDWRLKQVLRRA